MFLDDARILHRHEPAAERDNFRAAPHMFLVRGVVLRAVSLTRAS
jgi:hypothetical protein